MFYMVECASYKNDNVYRYFKTSNSGLTFLDLFVTTVWEDWHKPSRELNKSSAIVSRAFEIGQLRRLSSRNKDFYKKTSLYKINLT